MSFGIWRFLNGIQLTPVTGSNVNTAGEMEFSSSTNKFNANNGTSTSPVVTEAHAATLLNKTMDGGSNTFTNIPAAAIGGPFVKTDGSTPLTGDWNVNNHSISGLVNLLSNTDNVGTIGNSSSNRFSKLFLADSAAINYNDTTILTSSSNQKALVISGIGNNDANIGVLALINTVSPVTNTSGAGSLSFGFPNQGVAQSTQRVAAIQSNAVGSGGANGFGGNLIFATKGDNTTGISTRASIDQNGILTIFGGSISSNSTPATNGFIRMNSGNTIRIRNTNNTANNTISEFASSYFLNPNPSINADFLQFAPDGGTRPLCLAIQGAAGQSDYAPLFLTAGTTTGRVLQSFINSNASKTFGLEADFTSGLERFVLGNQTNQLFAVNNTGVTEIGLVNTNIHKITGQLQTPNGHSLTLTNGPGVSSGNPAVYLTLNINGTNYVIPAWTF